MKMLKICYMFIAFAGGYVLGKTGILDDPALSKAIAKGIESWIKLQDIHERNKNPDPKP